MSWTWGWAWGAARAPRSGNICKIDEMGKIGVFGVLGLGLGLGMGQDLVSYELVKLVKLVKFVKLVFLVPWTWVWAWGGARS